LGPVVQTLRYFAAPRTIAKFDTDHLVRQAQQAEANADDLETARQEDRQGLGLSRPQMKTKSAS